MHVTRTRGRRFAAVAVTVTLAATGGTLTASPATAAAVVSGTTQEAGPTAVPFPRDADVVGAGPSGFLTKTRGSGPEFRWTWYADGSSVVLPGATMAAAGGADLVVTVDNSAPVAGRVLRVYDLSTPATAAPAPQEVDLEALGHGYFFEGLAGNTLLLGKYEEGGSVRQYAATLDGGTPKPRWVAGSPGFDCHHGREGWVTTGSALYECHLEQTGSDVKVLVDLASDSSRWYSQTRDEWARDGAVSGTHVAWREARMSGSRSIRGIVAHRIGTPGEVWLPSDADLEDPVHLVGGWVASGQKAHIDASGGVEAGTVRPFTLQSIETGEKSVLLTAFSSAVAGPGGSLLVRGGTPEHGEGLYRISPRADGGRPDVEPVATTGQSTVVTLTGSTTPTTLTGEQVARGVDFAWDLSRGDSKVWLTLTHVPSRQTVRQRLSAPSGATPGMPGRFTWHWDGKDLEGRDWGSPAANGAYEWELTARPDDGIGPELVSTGRFTVTRPAAPHDYNDDGTADLLVRDAADGVLWRFGTRPAAPGGSLTDTGASRIGGGWGSYDRIESAGNIAGTAAPDVLARDATGALWLYQGTGDRAAPLSGRTRIGGGWQTYDRIAAGSDVTGDGRPDVLATDKSGALWLYPGTGNATSPFSARKALGGGWGVYNEIAAVGNLAGGPAGDLLARDRAGVLWLYLGKGDGTFAARTRVGTGWGAFTGLTAVGDANGDGRADLVAWNGDETFYAGTGDWRAPFKPGARVSLTQDSSYNAAF
ncbi:VCBS repeat-containing protein [Streptomyces sp. TX20-6-3]|uniref:VCBS repeat-containing protein n=1 Tax=Streptomyces sp. TX20-6-3 TaxID=3028705 RepID=UPI0029B5C1C9|nr:VCBS repeat-containing protein [Streptomyces sp. TX20-6-3]MDX2563792.1 VCBS repeat-containing protein [Streptomyces sp. TX20-6-3]